MTAKRSGPGALAGATEAGGDQGIRNGVSITASPRPRQPLDAPLSYFSRGWCTVPIPRGEKRPAMPGWPDFDAKPEHLHRLFGQGENIAVILGPKSSDLVDIDLVDST